MSRKNIEVFLEIGTPQNEISSLVAKISLHLDDYHRKLGGRGFRVGDYEDDGVLGVEILEDVTSDGYQVTLRLFPRSQTYDHALLDLTQDYVSSCEFRAWLNGPEDKNPDSE